MTEATFLTPKIVRKLGRPTVRKDGVSLTPAEHMRRYRARLRKRKRRQPGNGSAEWFTPREYIEAARSVLGEIES